MSEHGPKGIWGYADVVVLGPDGPNEGFSGFHAVLLDVLLHKDVHRFGIGGAGYEGSIGAFGSSAGGVDFAALEHRLMLRDLPGVFCAGEMLDWEAPTGGYLLTACLASGRRAGQGVRDWLGA